MIFDILDIFLDSCNKVLLLLNKSKIGEFKDVFSIIHIKH